MRIRRATLETCHTATGTVVAIDVIRAFTTAAFAFAAGARDIVLAGQVEEALALRERFPDALLMGEVNGVQPEGFDLGNSPSALTRLDLTGRRIIQRTSAGTQGVVRSTQAKALLASSFVCAAATAGYLRKQNPASVTFVVTGAGLRTDGDEDAACADYIQARLRGETPDVAPFLRRVRDSTDGRFFEQVPPPFPMSDLECCLSVDRFDFAMVVEQQDGLLVMQAVHQPGEVV